MCSIYTLYLFMCFIYPLRHLIISNHSLPLLSIHPIHHPCLLVSLSDSSFLLCIHPFTHSLSSLILNMNPKCPWILSSSSHLISSHSIHMINLEVLKLKRSILAWKYQWILSIYLRSYLSIPIYHLSIYPSCLSFYLSVHDHLIHMSISNIASIYLSFLSMYIFPLSIYSN
jgi:hypothetical protein